MANLTELSARLLKRFKNVPNVTIEDTTDWTEEAILAHGYNSTDDVPADRELLVLLYAQAEGAFQISLATAHYFQYTDGDESVNKATVSEQYRKLAQDLRGQYERNKAATTSTFRFLKRADR
jgi:hypothetical protein